MERCFKEHDDIRRTEWKRYILITASPFIFQSRGEGDMYSICNIQLGALHIWVFCETCGPHHQIVLCKMVLPWLHQVCEDPRWHKMYFKSCEKHMHAHCIRPAVSSWCYLTLIWSFFPKNYFCTWELRKCLLESTLLKVQTSSMHLFKEYIYASQDISIHIYYWSAQYNLI